MQHNLQLVLLSSTQVFHTKHEPFCFNLCQEGILGLIHGIDKFDPRKGYWLSTYVIYWIHNSILHAQTRSGHLLRTPFNVAAGVSFTFSSLAFLSSPPYDTLILLCHMLKAIDLSFNIHFTLLQHKQSIKWTSMARIRLFTLLQYSLHQHQARLYADPMQDNWKRTSWELSGQWRPRFFDMEIQQRSGVAMWIGWCRNATDHCLPCLLSETGLVLLRVCV